MRYVSQPEPAGRIRTTVELGRATAPDGGGLAVMVEGKLGGQ
jgi:hypothetical protein